MNQDTVVCRCEQVTAGKIWAEIEMGGKTLIDLKPARFAMGRCQGRVCEAIVCEILRQKGIDPTHLAPLHIRPPVVPLSISAVENKVSLEDMSL
jgi:NAD(P)H-nitrite reductase large subunit